ncbi:Gfo/Idh/MocA family oxidoreductase [Actinopolymorpha singaporensis]|uniref:Predicted dehydrogenase n=1 Tax=Actinopolymorpha singaporensis TaxID=117157 RepID=A0A1H1V220_9ACTN|nr:Gfo/Idh/MocA family oxidoreductase [Actinopolymorpha singaporensis]SDS78755.1 Predicted dehydrogenase [Actinopolymorpha singaporensis]
MSPLRVGVIGLGEVAQVIHLPILESLPELYELAAVCDLSPTLLDVVGRRYGVERRYDDFQKLARDQTLDCVLVLNNDEYHCDAVTAALGQSLHVLVEKPMCLSPREAERIVAARDASGCVVMVGYMRRFAPAFTAAKEQLTKLGRVNYVRVHDVIGRNQLLIDQTAHVLRPHDLPAAALADRHERGRRLVREALGDVPDVLGGTYRLLCGLGSHDLSAMRELLGRPRGVAAARQWRDGQFVVALFEYDDHLAVYETGVDEQLRFDAHIEVYGETTSMRIQYDTPYVRHLPTVLMFEESNGDAYTRSVVRPHLKDPYTHELEAFHASVTAGVPVRTTPEDFVQDLELFTEIIRLAHHTQKGAERC